MIYWVYNQRTDDFLSFENGVEANNLGGKVDVIKIMNRAGKVVSPVNAIKPQGITPIRTQGISAPEAIQR